MAVVVPLQIVTDEVALNGALPCSGTFDSDAWVDFGRALR